MKIQQNKEICIYSSIIFDDTTLLIFIFFFFCMVGIGFPVFIKTLETIINAVLFGHQTPLEGGPKGPYFESFSGFSGVVSLVSYW